MECLLAKSYEKEKYSGVVPEYALLTKHSKDVEEAAFALLQTVGQLCMRNAGIDAAEWQNFQTSLLLNAWTQDLGKANSHFQNMLQGESIKQLVRHEVVSAILVWSLPTIRAWLSVIPEKTLLIGLWGALGHHRKFNHETRSNNMFTKMLVSTTHPDFVSILENIAQSLELGPLPRFEKDLVLTHRSSSQDEISVADLLRQIKEDFREREKLLSKQEDRALLLLVKALGICADVCASAVAKTKFERDGAYSISNYIFDSIGSSGLSPSDFEKVIGVRLSGVDAEIDSRSDFQDRVAASEASLTLAIAGCGTGKSIAAYRWGQQRCMEAIAEGRNNFRFFFCLPTTGTGTEHFKDYALESGIEINRVNLTHSRAKVDLSTIATTTVEEEGDAVNAGDAAKECLSAISQQLDAIAWWSTPLVVTTADNVLGLMSYSRKAICGLPAIMSSAVVFDECHAFDDEMFDRLLDFIKTFPNLPILLMTASMPQTRLEMLREARSDLHSIPGPEDFEILPRYLLGESSVDSASLSECIRDCLRKNGKVLWVCNQVSWANDIYGKCRCDFGEEAHVNIYHSRLKYKHRSRRHRDVIDMFKQDDKPVLLVATQVAEMSLDISADLLITDLASAPAMIQRMGRLNRKSTPSNEFPPKKALVLPVKECAPYSPEEINLGESWLRSLIDLNVPLNQRHLAEELQSSNEKAVPKNQNECDLRQWETVPGYTRSQGYTISVIMEDDLAVYRRSSASGPDREWIRNHEVAIPIKPQVASWHRVRFTPVAPREDVEYRYDEITKIGVGALWKS